MEEIKEYYSNGKLKCVYTVDENGRKDGPYEKYHENGWLEEKYTYKDGREDGPYEIYWENGQLLGKVIYKMGQELSGQEAEDYLKQWEQEQEKQKKQKKQKKIDARLGGLKAKLKQLEDKEEIKKKLTARTPERLEKAAEIKQNRLVREALLPVYRQILSEKNNLEVRQAFREMIRPYMEQELKIKQEFTEKLARQRRGKPGAGRAVFGINDHRPQPEFGPEPRNLPAEYPAAGRADDIAYH